MKLICEYTNYHFKHQQASIMANIFILQTHTHTEVLHILKIHRICLELYLDTAFNANITACDRACLLACFYMEVCVCQCVFVWIESVTYTIVVEILASQSFIACTMLPDSIERTCCQCFHIYMYNPILRGIYKYM